MMIIIIIITLSLVYLYTGFSTISISKTVRVTKNYKTLWIIFPIIFMGFKIDYTNFELPLPFPNIAANLFIYISTLCLIDFKTFCSWLFFNEINHSESNGQWKIRNLILSQFLEVLLIIFILICLLNYFNLRYYLF